MKRLKFLVLYFIMLLPLCALYSNNIRVENVILTGQNTTDHYTMVEFDINWDNSWKDILNWDAAWVFVKYKGSDGMWNPAYLDVNDGNHTAPTGSVISPGVTGSYAPGIFIYRNSLGSGSIDWNDIQLRWNYGDQGVADDALVTVKVFAIEMVYVPQGSFDLGDGSAGSTTYHLYDAGSGSSQPFIVNTQGSISTGGESGNVWASGQIDAGTTDANYPTGYNAFYCMKYEITQEQYMDFLNTLTRTQQNTRTETDISITSITNRYVMSDTETMSYRNGIRCDVKLPASGPIVIYCNYDGDESRNEENDGQNIACNWFSWADGCAYADWAGLRPMTELEFEKACRGNQAALESEYAWGNVYIHASAYTLTDAGYYNEVISSQPLGIGNASYSTTDGTIDGPLRVGIFASTTTRQEAGASYNGIMELSGNLAELIVTIGNADGRGFQGNHGDGELSSNGNAYNVSTWPGVVGSEVVSETGMGVRGGSYDHSAGTLYVSARDWAATVWSGRTQTAGFRCVRTAP